MNLYFRTYVAIEYIVSYIVYKEYMKHFVIVRNKFFVKCNIKN